ncbi:MAG TPA: YciI family protein [Caulobacteraceae bacterium]
MFAVTLSRGPAWNPDAPLEGQADWDAHAALMDALEAEGFVAIGGPLDDTPYVLLIIRAADPVAVRARLDADPWHANRLLEISRIAPWTLRLGVGKV